MKLGYNRETIIGLSVLAILTIILGVVAARRFTHRRERLGDLPPPLEAKIDEHARQEHARDEHAREEIRAEKPILGDTIAAAALDGGHAHDDLGQWAVHPKGHREEKAEHAHDAAPIAVDPPKAELIEKHEHHEHTELERKGHEQPAASPTVATERYSVPGADRYSVPSMPTREPVDPDAARPMVIQVSGDGPDGPRHVERHEPERHVEPRENRPAFDSVRDGNALRGRDDVPNRNAMNQFDDRRPGPAETRGQYTSTGPTYIPRDPHAGYDSVASPPPMDNGAQGYPGPGGGYNRDNALGRAEVRHDEMRREEARASVAQPPLRNDGMYEVQPNDSYWTISERVYGNGAYFRALAELNRGKAARPDKLSPGLLVATPPAAQLEKDYPDFCPRPNRREAIRNRAAGAASMAAYSGGRTYLVQEGDTLTSIARNELGKVSRWAEIYQLNRDLLGKDYDYLTPGLRLALPSRDAQSPDRTTRRTDDAAPYMR